MMLPKEAYLAISIEGISLLWPDTKIAISFWPYRDVIGWNYTADRVMIKVGGLMMKDQICIRALTDVGQEICVVVGSFAKLANK
jgi:hypothetical protein